MFIVLYEVHLGVYYVRDLLRELDEGEHRNGESGECG